MNLLLLQNNLRILTGEAGGNFIFFTALQGGAMLIWRRYAALNPATGICAK
jgi:hypothetical protein